MSNIPTPHIGCADESEIAKTVLMPGDPLRAKYIADTYLTDVKCFTSVRHMYGFTGYYGKKRVSVMGSGMGMPSIGIYSYELFNNYGVENIIRVGSAGSYDESLHVYDTVLVTEAYSESNFARVAFGMRGKCFKANTKLNNKIKKHAEKMDFDLHLCKIHSSDVFYSTNPDLWKNARNIHGCMCVEMESFALFANAKQLGKRATCLLTISDSFVEEGVSLSAEERQVKFDNMIKLALESI